MSGPENGVWGSLRAYCASLMKAWYGDNATPENGFAYDLLPRIDGDHSHYAITMSMVDGDTKGYLVIGQNPVVGSANSGMQREALRSIDWLVVRDIVEIETAAFWQEDPENIATEVFFLPAASHVEKDGNFTNTQRLLQWHAKAVEPPEDCRSDLHFFYHLGRKIREKMRGSRKHRDRPILKLTWDYPTEDPHDEPNAEAVLREINGRDADGNPISKYQELKDDGSTTCGSWIHAWIFKDGVNQPNRRKPQQEQDWVAREWGWAWPADTRILYNRASADPDGKPWSERKRYVWWDADEEKWTSLGDDQKIVATLSVLPDKYPKGDMRAEAMWRLGWHAWKLNQPDDAIRWWKKRTSPTQEPTLSSESRSTTRS